MRLARAKFATIYKNSYEFELGKASIIKDGKHVAIFSTGIMVSEAPIASKILEKEGISAYVVKVSTIKPIDSETIIDLARRTGAVVTAEDHSTIGGLGGAIAEVLGEHMPTPMKRIGMRDRFGTSGNGIKLLEYFGLDAKHTVQAVHELLSFGSAKKSAARLNIHN